MNDEERDDPNAIPEGDPFEGYWENIVDNALTDRGYQSSRSLFRELIGALRTGSYGALFYPQVRNYLADRLEDALKAPKSSQVSGALNITRPKKLPHESKYGDMKSRFTQWYWVERKKSNNKLDLNAARCWCESQEDDDHRWVGDSTIRGWMKEAESMYEDPKSAYNMFKDVLTN